MSERVQPIAEGVACVVDDHHWDPAFLWPEDPEVGDSTDPDQTSLRMRHYHQHLWSGRPLNKSPDAPVLTLENWAPGLIDTHLADDFFGNGEGLFLSSDRAMPTWWNWTDPQVTSLLTDPGLNARVQAANPVLDNMGGIIMWPRRQLGGPSINQARGSSRRAQIADRLDLTLECIRLLYAGVRDPERNPLGPDLQRYSRFFDLFTDFAGYVDFWLLQDLVSDDHTRVTFLIGNDSEAYDFTTRSPLPETVLEYDTYLTRAQAFVLKRNERMTQVWKALT